LTKKRLHITREYVIDDLEFSDNSIMSLAFTNFPSGDGYYHAETKYRTYKLECELATEKDVESLVFEIERTTNLPKSREQECQFGA
jgi:hypothetical protein